MRAAFCLALAFGCLARQARAANDDGIPIGTQAAQTGAAVTATILGGASVYYNPAGIAWGDESSFDANLSAYGLRIVRVSDVLEGPSSSVDVKYIDWVIVPSLVSHVAKLSARLKLAYAIVVPKSQDYAIDVALRASDETRWQVHQEERSNVLNYGVGLGVKLRDDLRFGASLFGVYDSDHLLTSIFANDQGHPGRTLSALTVWDTREWGFNMRAGLQWDVRSWVLGVTLISPTFVVARTTTDIGSVFAPPNMDRPSGFQSFDRSNDTEATFDLSGEPQLRVGAAHRYARGHVALDGSLYLPLDGVWSGADRPLQFNLRAGLRHEFSPSWQIGSGLFTDRNTTRQNGLDFYGLTFGVSRTASVELKRGGALRILMSLNVRYAYGIGRVEGSRLPPLAETSVSELTFDSVSSRSSVNELSASIGSGMFY